MIHHGDCLDVMAQMEPESVDAIVTDPPYGLEFMGKEWDRLGDIGKSSHGGVTASSGSRDRSGAAAYSRFGVSHAANANRKCRSCGKWEWDHERRKCVCERPDYPNVRAHQGRLMQAWHQRWAEAAFRVAKPSAYLLAFGGTRTVHRMTVALEDAGWIIRDMLVWAYASGFPKSKASLKPAWEPIVMARKPGPLRMLAIDECRIPLAGEGDREFMASRIEAWSKRPGWDGPAAINVGQRTGELGDKGRWPANVILTDPIFDGGAQDSPPPYTRSVAAMGETGYRMGRPAGYVMEGYGDSGTYSRFFLIPKADRDDREPILGRRNEGASARPLSAGVVPAGLPRQNVHPTVKPTELMRHLVRLVTPAGGTVLDPFLGSGTTGLACELEGFPWIGIEREAEYVAIAEARLNGTQRGMGLSA